MRRDANLTSSGIIPIRMVVQGERKRRRQRQQQRKPRYPFRDRPHSHLPHSAFLESTSKAEPNATRPDQGKRITFGASCLAARGPSTTQTANRASNLTQTNSLVEPFG